MAHTTKLLSERDANQTLQSAYNDVDATVSVNGFLVGKVGHKIEVSTSTTDTAGDTQVFSFFDNGTLLYELTLIFTDSTQETLLSAERTA